MRPGAGEDGCICKGEWIWYAYGYISSEGLGSEPATVLGDAHTDGVLRQVLAGGADTGAGERVADPVAGADRHHADERVAAGAGAGVCQREVSEVRRGGAARDRHDGYVRRFELVLLPIYG